MVGLGTIKAHVATVLHKLGVRGRAFGVDHGPVREEMADARPATMTGRLSGVAGRRSAGILLFRRVHDDTEVLLGHMGGPFWSKRDAGAWSVPKGELEPNEDPEAAARREFQEELGLPVPDGELVALGEVRQAGGKLVTVWAVESDLDPHQVVPGTFRMEWPRGSGRIQEFAEIDRVEWFGLQQARERILVSQQPFLDRLAERV